MDPLQEFPKVNLPKDVEIPSGWGKLFRCANCKENTFHVWTGALWRCERCGVGRAPKEKA